MQIASCCYVCYFFLASFIPVCKERLKQQRKEKAARSAKQKEIFHHEILGTSWDSKGCGLMDLMFFNTKRARVDWLFIWDFPLGERPPGMGSNHAQQQAHESAALPKRWGVHRWNMMELEKSRFEVWKIYFFSPIGGGFASIFLLLMFTRIFGFFYDPIWRLYHIFPIKGWFNHQVWGWRFEGLEAFDIFLEKKKVFESEDLDDSRA